MRGDNGDAEERFVAPKPTWFDKAVERFAPQWALKRFDARLKLLAGRHMARKYEAAEQGRNRKIRKSLGSADATLMRDAEFMRGRARDLDENYDIATGILDVLEAKIVGTEIQVHPMVRKIDGTLATDLNQFMLGEYRKWAERPEASRRHTLGRCQRLSARSWMRDGENFVRHLAGTIPNFDHATDVPYSIQLLEADMVPFSFTGAGGTNSELLRYGILLDDWGKALVYYVYRRHPGEGRYGLFAAANSALRTTVAFGDLVDVPAAQMMHVANMKRIGQTRGVSAFAPVFNRLSDLKDYEESEQMAARIGSYVALQITKSIDSAVGQTGQASPRELKWMPGMIFDQLAKGEEVKSITNERPSNQVGPWREQSLKATAAGTRTGYSSIAKDYNGTYSAQRQELVENEVSYAVLTEEFIGMKVRPTYQGFNGMLQLSGRIPRELMVDVDLETMQSAAYRGPAVAYIDPVKEINAELIGVQAGFISKQDVQLRRGQNPGEVIAELKSERQKEEDDGIVTTSNPAWKTPAGGRALSSPPTEDGDSATDDEGNRYVGVAGKWVPEEWAALAESAAA